MNVQLMTVKAHNMIQEAGTYVQNTIRTMPRAGQAALLMASALILAGCESVAITPDDFTSAEAFTAWGCTFIAAAAPFVFVLVILLGVLNIFLYGIAQLGQGVLPGGIVSFAQNNMGAVFKGTIVILILPTLFIGVGGSAFGIDVSGCVLVGAGG